mmetsp:Transcript_4291/g.13539  ORF Transcript_4291/g.13539 Transcript_4291/m.13539 type:complete len:228 (-) Transcript_4291:987-1670(-)
MTQRTQPTRAPSRCSSILTFESRKATTSQPQPSSTRPSRRPRSMPRFRAIPSRLLVNRSTVWSSTRSNLATTKPPSLRAPSMNCRSPWSRGFGLRRFHSPFCALARTSISAPRGSRYCSTGGSITTAPACARLALIDVPKPRSVSSRSCSSRRSRWMRWMASTRLLTLTDVIFICSACTSAVTGAGWHATNLHSSIGRRSFAGSLAGPTSKHGRSGRRSEILWRSSK